MNLQPTLSDFLTRFWLIEMIILSHKPDSYITYITYWHVKLRVNYASHSSLKLTRTSIRGLRSNFVGCESFLESNSDILAFCEINLDDSIDSSNFSVKDYPLLMWKDSFTYMQALSGYVKDGLPFARDLSLESSEYYYSCFRLTVFHSVCDLFSLCR